VIKKIFQKIFKKISYSIFFKIYGKIEKTIDFKSDERIKVNNVSPENGFNYKIYEVENGRLYTDRIHDTAFLIDKKIINGPSFQFRFTHDFKTYNSNTEDNIVFKKGTPRILKNLNGKVLSLLTGGAGNNNYWHWMFDVLPRLFLFNKIYNLNEVDYFLVPSEKELYQKETLDILNIPLKKRISSEKYRHIKAEKIIGTSHPVVITGNATKDIMDMPFWISKYLKKYFIKNNKTNNEKIRKIYIDRSDDRKNSLPQRNIFNENEVKDYLIKNGFVPVRLHNTKFIDQVRLFNNAETIAGLHGGGFANIVFCKAQTQILELRSRNSGPVIENLAKKNDLNYNSIVSEAKQIYKFDYPNQQGSIKVSIDSLKEFVKNTL